MLPFTASFSPLLVLPFIASSTGDFFCAVKSFVFSRINRVSSSYKTISDDAIIYKSRIDSSGSVGFVGVGTCIASVASVPFTSIESDSTFIFFVANNVSFVCIMASSILALIPCRSLTILLVVSFANSRHLRFFVDGAINDVTVSFSSSSRLSPFLSLSRLS